MGNSQPKSYVAAAGYQAAAPGEDPAAVQRRADVAMALQAQADIANQIIQEQANDNPFTAIDNVINSVGDGAKKGAEDATTILIVGGVIVLGVLLLK